MDNLPDKIKGVKYHEEMVAVDQSVRLRTMIFKPEVSQGKSPVIFVAGWVSIFSGWKTFISALARQRNVYYLETREKESAIIDSEHFLRDNDFSIYQNAKDIIQICEHFGINSPQTIACGSSLGATSLLEAMKNGKLKVGGAFLIGPNSEFAAPRALLWILYLPIFFYKPVICFLKWYLRHFRVDAEKEPEQMKRYEEIFNTVNPSRLKHSARATILENYQVWPDIETILPPVAIAYASSDKLHNIDNIMQMARRLPRGKLNECPTNLYMHSEKLVDDISKFESEIDRRPLTSWQISARDYTENKSAKEY